jgi:transcriptional regulator with GAF, ATPase, and Fis domain
LELVAGRSYSVGRRASCDLVVKHDSVSRDHATIFGGDPPSIQDVGSRNGTRVLGRRLEVGERVELPHLATVEVGGCLLVVHHGEFAADGGPERMTSGEAVAPRGPHVDRLPPGTVLEDPAMRELYRTAEIVAKANIPVLILGETGVGKEVLAQALHTLSPRTHKPFVHFNSAALPESLVESELFGYERGAFTGAERTKAGLFEAADGGTIFLDEVGELAPTTQAKLLRALETGHVLRLGAVDPTRVDARVLAATNRDLRALMSSGAFRQDLFYRLNGISLVVPPLRARPADIPRLVEHFVARSARTLGKPSPVIAREAMQKLCAHRWPGNVRELRNAVERVVLLAEDAVVTPEMIHLDEGSAHDEPGARRSSTPPDPSRAGSDFPLLDSITMGEVPAGSDASKLIDQLRTALANQERQRVLDALNQKHGNQAEAAKLLGMSRRTLLNRLDTLGIPRPRKSNRG